MWWRMDLSTLFVGIVSIFLPQLLSLCMNSFVTSFATKLARFHTFNYWNIYAKISYIELPFFRWAVACHSVTIVR